MLQDWDARARGLPAPVRRMGVAVVTYVVRSGPTTRPFEPAADELGTITHLTPEDIESRLSAAEHDAARSEGGALAGAPA